LRCQKAKYKIKLSEDWFNFMHDFLFFILLNFHDYFKEEARYGKKSRC
jgi:hypothetical protein